MNTPRTGLCSGQKRRVGSPGIKCDTPINAVKLSPRSKGPAGDREDFGQVSPPILMPRQVHELLSAERQRSYRHIPIRSLLNMVRHSSPIKPICLISNEANPRQALVNLATIPLSLPITLTCVRPLSQLVICQDTKKANNLLKQCYCNCYGVQLSKTSLCLNRPILLIKVWFGLCGTPHYFIQLNDTLQKEVLKGCQLHYVYATLSTYSPFRNIYIHTASCIILHINHFYKWRIRNVGWGICRPIKKQINAQIE